MARANHDLISALRQTAQRLSGDVSYQRTDVVLYMRAWADMLAETVAAGASPAAIAVLV